MRHLFLGILLFTLAGCSLATGAAAPSATTAPLAIGETFTMRSEVLGEVRRINVYMPPGHGAAGGARLPVLYMPDGGIAEDFLHVAGLVQVSAGNGTMRPFLLVGIENTERRRDMTGPTANEEDRKIAPRVGGSAAFRKFIRTELMPEVQRRYATSGETAIVGESLAGLFIVETLFLEPDLFDTYIAFDPSLWWNDGELVRRAASRKPMPAMHSKRLYLATSSEKGIAEATARLGAALKANPPAGLQWQHETLPQESHATIYHPAATRAFRTLFAPAGAQAHFVASIATSADRGPGVPSIDAVASR